MVVVEVVVVVESAVTPLAIVELLAVVVGSAAAAAAAFASRFFVSEPSFCSSSEVWSGSKFSMLTTEVEAPPTTAGGSSWLLVAADSFPCAAVSLPLLFRSFESFPRFSFSMGEVSSDMETSVAPSLPPTCSTSPVACIESFASPGGDGDTSIPLL